MKINEVTISKKQALTEAIDATNDTGFLTEDLVKIVEAEEKNEWSKPVPADQLKATINSWFD